jgi:hypothetical protein
MKLWAERMSPQEKVLLGEAVDRLIDLGEAKEKSDDVKMWTNEKATLSAGRTPTPQPENR